MSRNKTQRIFELGSRWQNFEEESNAVPDGLTQSNLLKGAAQRNYCPEWYKRFSDALLSTGQSKRDLNDLMRKERVLVKQETKAQRTSVGSEALEDVSESSY
jgi:hypothetical protein